MEKRNQLIMEIILFIILFPGLILSLPPINGVILFTLTQSILSILAHSLVFSLIVKIADKITSNESSKDFLVNIKNYLIPIFVSFSLLTLSLPVLTPIIFTLLMIIISVVIYGLNSYLELY